MAREFTVGLARMSETIEQMAQFDRQVEGWCDELEKRIQALHVHWSGEAADAQKEAHEKWTASLNDMRADLAALRRIAKGAHANYTEAGNKAKQMWSF